MHAIARFEIALARGEEFAGQLDDALEALASCPGYLGGEVGRNLDQPTLFSLITRWENIGAYRRALSSMRVKLEAIPVLALAIDEPGAYE